MLKINDLTTLKYVQITYIDLMTSSSSDIAVLVDS